MTRKGYIFVFDRSLRSDYTKLHKAIKDNRNILNWWHYLTSGYILISTESASELTNFMRENLPSDTYFIIMEINHNNYNGWLPQEAWDWIRENIGTNIY
ncbi:hypothetical protein A2954_06575 [Candidatus Roizmanbacteria bacterium RIFCSPLOWO2_01_FULL_37_12]|uniref:SinR family protein n=1 Tax=Candidatus Roizmanbacteria bacterium RIFCSPLOWO2_01_FULL_37_12 TaxID=1802056 RepID=A0A1F7I8J0_9BACT|nr:MAG: hypothetical protein A2768_00155 [Candidatus Roizmanbacteria bacterium RIFCSPHIGHO2_01_FULL_37_16]OGK39673.1 MAG: hypothetical protein A2954_06575 [Candidatus Roizmanbacteria bacterium RIFCSPLOWO2_01_FULL_37_12]